MIRRPPRSTLFPYRRSSDLSWSPLGACRVSPGCSASPAARPSRSRPERRSEEHTSELQSQSNLVCRLLLEKKNSNVLIIRCITIDTSLMTHPQQYYTMIYSY